MKLIHTQIIPSFLVGALVIGGAMSLGSCAKTSSADSTGKSKQEIYTVQTAPVEMRTMTSKLKVTGSLEGIREAVVQSETQGRILSIVHTIGDRVGQGTPLVKVDDELKAIAVEQATAQRLAAEASLEKAQLDDKRNQELLQQNAITKNQVEMSALQVKSAEAALKSAQSAESLAKRQLADATVKAPFPGVVSDRFVNQGETLNPGTKVETLVDDSKMKFKMFVNELDVRLLKTGDKVIVNVDAIPGTPITGTITNISDKADQSRSYEVDVELPNEKHALKSGMFARAEVELGGMRDVTAVPTEALIFNGTTTNAYVVKGGIASLKAVTLGTSDSGHVEILSGLAAGDNVVIFGQGQLHDGAKVR